MRQFAMHIGAASSKRTVVGSSVTPSLMNPPVLVPDGTDTIFVGLASAPPGGNAPISRFDLRVSSDGVAWSEVIGITDPETLSGLTEATVYFVQTRAVNTHGAGPWSFSATTTTGSTATSVPDQMAAPALTVPVQQGVLLVDAASAPADGGSPILSYDLRYSDDGAAWSTVTDITDPETLSGLIDDTGYFVQTRAVNANGPGPWSASASATTRPVPATVPDQMAAPVLAGPTPIEHRTISVARAGAPADGGSAILSYDLRYSTDQANWATVSDISSAENLEWLQTSTAYFVQTRAVNGTGNGPWSVAATHTTAALPVPIDYALEPFLLQPPIDRGDGDPEADNLTRAETDVFEAQGVFERFTDGRVRLIVDGSDPGTSPGTDPRCEHRGLAERAATTAASFRVKSQIVSVEDGGSPVSGPSTRVTLFQNYNLGIGNPDITVDGYVDLAGSTFKLRIGWRPAQTDSTVVHVIDTGLAIAPDGSHPVADFRVDRYADRFEIFYGPNVLGSEPDFASGDNGTPGFARSVTDGDYCIKFGNYLHLDAADPITTRAIVDVFSETSATAIETVVSAPEAVGSVGDQSYLRLVAIAGLDLSTAFTGTGLIFALSPASDALPAGLVLGANGVLSGTPDEATQIGQPVQVIVRATNLVGFAETSFALDVSGPLLGDLLVNGTQVSFTTDVGDGDFYLWFGTSSNPSDTEIETGTGPDHLESASFPVSGNGGQLLNFDLSAHAGQSGYLLVMHVAGSGAASVPVFEQVSVSSGATVPEIFGTGDWNVVDADIGQTVTLSVASLPSDGGSPLSDLEVRVDGVAWASVGAVTPGSYAIGGLANGTAASFEMRAVNANGAGPASGVKSATPTAGRPEAFAAPDWSVQTGAGSAKLDLTLSALPAGNGDTVSSVEYEVDASGTWIALASFAGLGTYSLDMAAPATSFAIRLRAVNGQGVGVASNSAVAISSAQPLSSHLASGDWSNRYVASDTQSLLAGTLTALPLGTKLAICVSVTGAQGGDPSEAGGSVTIGGVPATLRRAAQSGGSSNADASFSIWEADAPSGFSNDLISIDARRNIDEWAVDLFNVSGFAFQTGLGSNLTGDASTTNPVILATTSQANDQIVGGIACRSNESGSLSFGSGLSAVSGHPVNWGGERSRLVGLNTNATAFQSISINRAAASADFAACAVVYR